MALLSVLDILTFYFQPHSAGYQGWLHLSSIINNAAMVILVSGLLWTYEQTPLKYMPRSEIVKTKGDTRGHHIQFVLHRCIQPASQWGLKNRPLPRPCHAHALLEEDMSFPSHQSFVP